MWRQYSIRCFRVILATPNTFSKSNIFSLVLFSRFCASNTQNNYFVFGHTNWFFSSFLFLADTGLLRLQQIYQGLRPGNETFQVEMVKRITNASNAIEFLKTLEDMNRWSKKYIVLDCPTVMAKEIVVYHVRDLSLGRRTYHYLLSGLVSNKNDYSCGFFIRRMIFFLSSFFVLFDFLCFVNFLSFLRIFFFISFRSFLFCSFTI